MRGTDGQIPEFYIEKDNLGWNENGSTRKYKKIMYVIQNMC